MTTITRRSAIAALTLLGLSGTRATDAAAQDYPSRDIRLICAFPPGSGADVFVRFVAERLRPVVGRTIIVENKPGAAGNIAAEFVVRSAPDGHTIYLHSGAALAGNFHLFKNPPFDPTKELKVAATINKQPFMLAVASNSPYQTLEDLTAAMKQKGDKASYATSNTVAKVTGELYKQLAGLQAVEVNFRSGLDTLNDMQSGSVDYAIYDPVIALSQAREGRVRILAVSTDQRLGALPDLPTFAEAGLKGINIYGWFAAFLPAGTPRPVIDKINGWFAQILPQEETRKTLANLGGDVFMSKPEEGQALLEKDVRDWEDYVRVARIPKN